MHARRDASTVEPAAFPRAAILKVANHPLLPQFSNGPNRTSLSQVRTKANTPELSRSRGNVVPLNEKTTKYGRVRRIALSPSLPPSRPDSMSLPEFFSPDISARCARHPPFLPFGNRSIVRTARTFPRFSYSVLRRVPRDIIARYIIFVMSSRVETTLPRC